MKVTAIGHAGLKIQTEDAFLLMDPWLSPEGTFQSSWFQFPDNSHLLADKELYKPTAVIISHEHLDHCDSWFLAKIDRDIPVIIPKYPSSILKQKINEGGERPIIEVPEWEVHKITPHTEVFFVSEPPMNHDSAIIIQADGQTVLNMNDARLFPMQLRDIKRKVGGTIDMFCFQGSGASWFPILYNFPERTMKKLKKQKRAAKLSYCHKTMKIVDPNIGFPFAGPPCFLDPALFKHNSEMASGIFPDQQQVKNYLAHKSMNNVIILLPGDSWRITDKKKENDPHWKNYHSTSRSAYLEEYQKRRQKHIDNVYRQHPYPHESLWKPFKEYMEELLSLSPYFNKHIDMRVGFEITGTGGGDWYVDFRNGRGGVGKGLKNCEYIYTLESRWLPPILEKKVPWEDFFLSLRFQAQRSGPYNDHLLGLLKFAEKEALEKVENFETTPLSKETITVHSGGNAYSIPRYCPHAGNDFLLFGQILPGGILRCLAHHYDFDLKTGKCLTSSCQKLQTKLHS